MRKVLYFFSKFSDQDVDWLVGTGAREDFQSGHVLIKEGQKIETLYITLSGSFKATMNEKHITTIGSGEVIGELSFLDSRPPNVSVICTEKSVVLSILVSRLRSKLSLDTGFASRFYLALGVLLADRLRETVSQLAVGSSRNLDASTEEFGEISSELLDDTSLAAARFDKLRKTFMSGY